MNRELFESCFSPPHLETVMQQANLRSNYSQQFSPYNLSVNTGNQEETKSATSLSTAQYDVNLTSTAHLPLDRSEDLNLARDFFRICHPIICVFGLLGNTLTLLVLTRKRLKKNCEGTENNMNIGLTALAVSDFLFCLVVLPYGFQGTEPFDFQSKSFKLIYMIYGTTFINTFILTSTWLTVTMATSRYLAICHPFRARAFISTRGTRISIFLVFVICFLVNVPRLFESQIGTVQCFDGKKRYFKTPGYVEVDSIEHKVYTWVYSIVGIFLPLAMLAFCNICLVKALHASSKLRRRCRVPAAHVESNYRITSILVTIVVMYIVLVSPAEIVLFIQGQLSHDNDSLMLALEVTNLLQITNFSCNFVLYCVLNVHFRNAMRDLFCGCAKKKDGIQEITLRTRNKPMCSYSTVKSYV